MPKEATELLNFPTELYIGTEQLKAFDVADPPLAFATPNGKDSAFAKRKENVDRWCGNGMESVRVTDPVTGEFMQNDKGWVWENRVVGTTKPFVIPNTFLSGYSFDRAIERYVTNNKVFRITDPRGFQLEISADNLADIILNCEIKNGVLQGEFIWARQRGTNFLCRKDHPSYIQSVNPVIARTTLQVGDHVYLSNKRIELVYCGEVFCFTVKENIIDQDRGYLNGSRWKTKYYSKVEGDADTKPWKVFKEVGENEGSYDGPWFYYRNPSKIEILSEGNPLPEDFEIGGKFGPGNKYGTIAKAYFATKEELLAFHPSWEEMRDAIAREANESYETEYVR